MLYYLENESFKIRVNSRGAELESLYSKKLEREYLWQAASEAWSAHSLLLFPACGRVGRSRMIARGKEYPLPMHGFAKDAEFELVEKTDSTLTLVLKANEETLRMFPYDFALYVDFSLTEDKIVEGFRVVNNGGDDMYFSLGGHPAFFCPIDVTENADDYVLEFDCEQSIINYPYTDGTRLLMKDGGKVWLSGKEMPLSDSFFDNGPYLLGNVKANTVTLKSKKSGRFMEMAIKDFPFMTLWGVGKAMQIIAIEPWCGTSDVDGTNHVWEEKFGNEKVAPAEVFERRFEFRLG